jgi:hypothetical protein
VASPDTGREFEEVADEIGSALRLLSHRNV